MLVYLSGPMTGLPEHNYPAFTEAAAHLRESGHEVLNPAETAGGSTRLDRHTYLSVDVGYVRAAEALVMLPDWTESKGAKLEVVLADSFDKPIYLYDGSRLDGIGVLVRIDEVMFSWSMVTTGMVQHMSRGAPTQLQLDEDARQAAGPGGCSA